jgi:para-aminobenzoate synthetase / 4-amino-4-deoxychorismate lyase
MNCILDFPDEHEQAARYQLQAPIKLIQADTADQVNAALGQIQEATDSGYTAAGYVAYEAAAAFDSAMAKALQPMRHSAMPLLYFGVYAPENICMLPPPPWTTETLPTPPNWQLDTERDEFDKAITQIRQTIVNGDCYQVNYALRAHSAFEGDDEKLYEQLRAAQQSRYSAYLNLGRWRVLSASPELFFQRAGDGLLTRPMKGTTQRGRNKQEDELLAQALHASVKNRAENVMIVDLLRNDVSRVSVPGGVQVLSLFDVERYPTVQQMTSTVQARLKPHTKLADIFEALFPCGSITGAPKIMAMRKIRNLENTARGVYCGAVGWVRPGKRACFNVAIRTVIHDSQQHQLTCGLGGGITWDSKAGDEYDEVKTKALFLGQAPQCFELLETLLLDKNVFTLRARHLVRLKQSAAYFGFNCDEKLIEAELEALATSLGQGAYRVRLLLSQNGRLQLQSTPINEDLVNNAFKNAIQPISLPLAHQPVKSTNRFLFHKTTQRHCYEEHTKAQAEFFDVLLWNEKAEVTEFSKGNVVVEIEGQLLTPPLSSGLLAGTLREELLASGDIHERVITKAQVMFASRVWFINSVRGWLPVKLLAQQLTASY